MYQNILKFPDSYVEESKKYDDVYSIIYLNINCPNCNAKKGEECPYGNCSERISYFISHADVRVRACADVVGFNELSKIMSVLTKEDLFYITPEEYNDL